MYVQCVFNYCSSFVSSESKTGYCIFVILTSARRGEIMYTVRWKKFKLLDLRAVTGTRMTRKTVFVLFVTIGRGAARKVTERARSLTIKNLMYFCVKLLYTHMLVLMVYGVSGGGDSNKTGLHKISVKHCLSTLT